MTEDLLFIFEETLRESFPELSPKQFHKVIVAEIESKKYDIQDRSLLEIALRDERKVFRKSLAEAIELRVADLPDKKTFFLSDEGKKEVALLLTQTLEHTIDYYYNTVIGRHFSSS